MGPTQPQSNNGLLNIKSIIQFGSRKSELFSIPTFKLDGENVKVRIRGLSNYEFDEINIEMYGEVKDPETIRFVFDIDNENQLEELSEEEKEKEKFESKIISEIDREIPEVANPVEILKAYMYKNVLIVYHAMKDYYPTLKISDVKQLEGIREIAKRVNEKSGRTKETQDQIEFFREK